MIKPRIKPLAMSGVGGCVGTEKKVLTGQVMAVKTFEELKLRGKEAVGKFVLINYDYHNYSDSAKYRGLSVSEASRYGGVAALVIIHLINEFLIFTFIFVPFDSNTIAGKISHTIIYK
jgi:hypothetical protein